MNINYTIFVCIVHCTYGRGRKTNDVYECLVCNVHRINILANGIYGHAFHFQMPSLSSKKSLTRTKWLLVLFMMMMMIMQSCVCVLLLLLFLYKELYFNQNISMNVEYVMVMTDDVDRTI